MDTNETLTLDEAVAYLETSRPTFYRWLQDGKVKGFRVGRKWRFRVQDLAALREPEHAGVARALEEAIEFYRRRLQAKGVAP